MTTYPIWPERVTLFIEVHMCWLAFVAMLPETVGAHGVGDGLTARTASCVRRSYTSSASSRHTRPMTDPFTNVFGAHTGSDTGHGVAEIQTPRHSIFQCKNSKMPFIGKINSCATCSHSASDQINISLYQCIQNIIWYNMILHMAWDEISHDGCCNATHGGDISSDILIATQQAMCVQWTVSSLVLRALSSSGLVGAQRTDPQPVYRLTKAVCLRTQNISFDPRASELPCCLLPRQAATF